MRMWQVDPRLLCRKHLLGKHGELHKFRHNFEKQHNMSGRVLPVVQIEPANMEKRHDELAKEMQRRGYKHESPYTQPDISYLPRYVQNAKVDIQQATWDLVSRCPDCYDRVVGENSESEDSGTVEIFN